MNQNIKPDTRKKRIATCLRAHRSPREKDEKKGMKKGTVKSHFQAGHDGQPNEHMVARLRGRGGRSRGKEVKEINSSP